MQWVWGMDRKVWSGGLTFVLAYAIGWALHRWTGLDLGTEGVGLIAGALGYGVSYLVPPAQQDIVKRLDNYLVAVAGADKNSPVSAEVLKAVPAAARIDAIADVKSRGVNIVPTPPPAPPRTRREDDAL